MRIDRIELFHVEMPLISPWRTAYGEDASIQSVLCRMTSGSVDAWGESCPLAAPCYSPEWAGGVFSTARNWLAPAIIGRDIDSGDQLQTLLSAFKGNSFAKAALDTAWWALESRLTNTPLHKLIGATREEVVVGADFGVTDDIDDLLKSVGEAVDAKFPRVKLKYRPGWDLDMLRAVRQQHPDHPIHIDCNSGYTINDIDMFRQVDEFRLEMIEQPLQHDDLTDHAQLQKLIETPVCLDESISNVGRAQQAVNLASCRYINIKPGRVGGITNAVAINNLCQEANIPCWIGGMLESATGVGFCVALSMLDNCTYPADIFPSSRFYHQDLSDTPLFLSQSPDGIPSIRAQNDNPSPNLTRIKDATLQSATIE